MLICAVLLFTVLKLIRVVTRLFAVEIDNQVVETIHTYHLNVLRVNAIYNH